MQYQLTRLATLLIAGLLTNVGYAATQPGSAETVFDNATANATMNIRYKSWSDPAFGNLGWTHTSSWGGFTATKGQIVTLTFTATDIGIHPGATIWYRGEADTAPDSYVPDHVYPESTSQIKYGATDEVTGASIGDIVMTYVTSGYDADNNVTVTPALKPKFDKKNGRLVLKFKAPNTGKYHFVLGGISPDLNVDPDIGHNIKVNFKIQ
jgi:hypothetical protein